MPIPGPRMQGGPLPGYDNPGREVPDRFNLWDRPGPVVQSGRSPGTMRATLRGSILAPGTIRRLWQQSVNYMGAQRAYSWTHGLPEPDRPVAALGVTRALRYMTRSVYAPSGVDNSRYAALHTKIAMQHRHKPVTVAAGSVRNRPTVRNRLTSFGSRVPPLNARNNAAQ